MNIPTLPKEKINDEDFFNLCRKYPEAQLERDERGYAMVSEPTGSYTGYYSSTLMIYLGIWNIQNGFGLTFDSSTGFTLPTGAIRSPDAAWASNERWQALSEDLKEKFAPFCPDFVAEIRSPSDDMEALRDKMHHYIAAGARLAWLFDRINECVYIYTPGRTEEKVDGFDGTLSGGDVLPGFEFDLSLMKKR